MDAYRGLLFLFFSFVLIVIMVSIIFFLHSNYILEQITVYPADSTIQSTVGDRYDNTKWLNLLNHYYTTR